MLMIVTPRVKKQENLSMFLKSVTDHYNSQCTYSSWQWDFSVLLVQADISFLCHRKQNLLDCGVSLLFMS